MLDRITVFAAAPSATFLTLLLQLFLRLCIGEAEVELDAGMIVGSAMEVLDHTLCDLTGLESTGRLV